MVEILINGNLQADSNTVKDEFSIKGITATAYSGGNTLK